MTPADDHAAAQAPAYRSRWRRFSPSMGWKAFWSEIVIVVLGVAIALAANEAVQTWSWNSKVRDGEARLRSDVAWAFLWAAEQYVTKPCVQAQLEGLTSTLMESGTTLAAVPKHSDTTNSRYVVRAPYRPYRFPVWEGLVANGTAPHFSQQRQDAYGNLNDGVALSRLVKDETHRLMGRLMAMAYPTALDAGVRREFLVDLEALRHRNAADSLVAWQRMVSIVEFGSAPNAEAVEAFLKRSGTVMFCKERGLPLADWRDVQKRQE